MPRARPIIQRNIRPTALRGIRRVIIQTITLFRGPGIAWAAELEAQMGMNRSSLYAEFGSKHGVYEAALEHYLTHVVPGFIGELSSPEAGMDAIEAVLARFASWAGAPGVEGCMICNAATETATNDEMSRAIVQRYVDTLQVGFQNALGNAVAVGELDPALNVEGWSAKLATTLLGMMVLIRARVNPTLAHTAASLALGELRRSEIRSRCRL